MSTENKEVVFPLISEWLKTKVSIDPLYLKCVLGETNYNILRNRISTTKKNLLESDFADNIISQLEIIKFSSKNPDEINTVNAFIMTLNNRYNLEKQGYINKQAQSKRIYEKIQLYTDLMQSNAQEFLDIADNGFNIDEGDTIAYRVYNEYIQNLFNRYKDLEEKNIVTDDIYMNTLSEFKGNAIAKLRSELERKETAIIRGGNNPLSFSLKLSDITRELENECSICYEEYGNKPISLLECGHIFHEACLNEWFTRQNTCPKCRSK